MDRIDRYAHLLAHYCLELKKGETCLVQSTFQAEPLLRSFYRQALILGAHVDFISDFREKDLIFYTVADTHQLNRINPAMQIAMQTYDAFLNIRAPYNLTENKNIDPEKRKFRQNALQHINQTYFDRTGSGAMRRTLCQYPTLANAQIAEMSLSEYEDFVYDACMLNETSPIDSWLKVRAKQQKVVDFLHQKETIRYCGPEGTDIQFSTTGRKWINSDGRTNMPSGEVFTAPVEDSVNGVVYFSYPGIYMGHEIKGIRLWVEKGKVTKWEAQVGKELLDQIFAIPGARYFGEAAIGTNYRIQKITKNILFDEKIGGSIHMAVGQSYLQAGGKNKSTIHWDMITDMKNGGAIIADGETIYKNGEFVF